MMAAGAPAWLAGVLGEVRCFFLRRPEWWVMLAAAVAWAAMLVGPAGHASHGAAHATADLRWIGLMVVAMMAPLTVSGVRHVALASLRRRRRRSVVEFMAGYVGVWVGAAALMALCMAALATRVPWAVVTGLTVSAAVLWELAPARRRQLARCERTVPLAPRGWRADRACLRFGAERGVSCVATCWALMLVCTAFAHSVPVMAILFATRMAPLRQRRFSPALGVAGVFLAALAGVAG